MIKLLVKSSEESREVEFNGETVTIGRSSENVLKLNDKKASRHHARIEKVDGEYRVFDLGSGNGTKVNGSDIPGSQGLNKGDEIHVGLSTLYVLNLDAPAKAAVAAPSLPVASPAPLPVAAAAPAPAPAVVAPAPAAASHHTERRGPSTRRSQYAAKSSSGGLVAVVAILIIGGAIFFAASRMGPSAGASSAGKPKPSEKKIGPTINEANEAYQTFKVRAGAGAPSEETLAEADRLADKFGEIYPDFRTLAADVRTRRNEGLSGKSLQQVKPLVDKAVDEQRFGDAIDALKVLRGGADAEAAGKLLVTIESKVDEEYKSLVEAGNKLVADKQYAQAAEKYREAAPKFRNTSHYKTVSNKPENLMEMAQAEVNAQKAREARAAAKAEADAALAKAETAKPAPMVPEMKPAPKPEMKPEMPKPAMKPEMKPEMPKPKPEMPKPPPPPPPPPPPAPEPKKEEAKTDGPRPAIKKPDVLCEVKKTAKGTYCIKCDRTLGPDDIRGGNCKKCDEKPKKIDLCVKRFFQSECEHKKVDDKPVFCCGKVHDFPQEDRSRIVYLCEACGEGGDIQSEIKHGAECKNRLSGTKICLKSGTPPHAPDKK